MGAIEWVCGLYHRFMYRWYEGRFCRAVVRGDTDRVISIYNWERCYHETMSHRPAPIDEES